MEKLFDIKERTDVGDLQEKMALLQKLYEEICRADQVSNQEEGLLIHLAGQQNKETGFWELVKGEVPSDVRVDFRYKPTYFMTAILIKAYLVSDRLRGNKDITPALAKGLDASAKRQFEGHGFEALDGYLQAVSIFVRAGADRFVRLFAGFSPVFTGLWEKVQGRLSLLAYGNPAEGFVDPDAVREKALLILKDLEQNNNELILDEDESLYFAYGSNMDEGRMKSRCPRARILGPGVMPGFELTFRKSGSGYYASIDAVQGAFVPIVIWILQKEDLQRLDRCEGVGNPECYIRIRGRAQFGLQTIDGYYYHLPSSRAKGKPHEDYLDLLEKAYRRWGFDEHELTPKEASYKLHQ